MLIANSNLDKANTNSVIYDNFNKFDPADGVWNIVSKASGDIVQVDGNTLASNYLAMSLDPLAEDTTTIIDSVSTINSPEKELKILPSCSQRVIGHEFTAALVSVETPATPTAPIAISSISQTTTTLSITTLSPHGLQVGDRISISDIPDSRLNYNNLVVGANIDLTSFTCTSTINGGLSSFTSSVYNTGTVHLRPVFDYIPNAVGIIFEGGTSNQHSFFIKNGSSGIYPSGAIGGTHNVTNGGIISSQAVAANYDNINFSAPSSFEIHTARDFCEFLDRTPNSSQNLHNIRTRNDPITIDPRGQYKVRLKIRANKSNTRPIAKITTITKTGTTTATVSTDVAHGLNINDFVNIFGVRDQTNFPNLATATQVASIVDATNFTIIIGSATTATSYGGYVSRVNGGINQGGAIAQSIQSISRTNNILTLIGSANWSGVVVGDYVNIYSCRIDLTGADAGVDGVYRVSYFTTTTLILTPISAPTGANIASTNCGGGVIKRSDFRIHRIILDKVDKVAVEVRGGTAKNDPSSSTAVILVNTPTVGLSANQAGHSNAASGNPVRVAGRVVTSQDTGLINNDVSDLFMTTAGQLVIKNYASSEFDWQYTGTLTTTTAVAMTAAGPASVRSYLTGLVYQNTSATATTILILDGGSTIATFQASASMSMPAIITFPTPIKSSAAIALNINCGTTGANVIVSSQGYKCF